MVAVRKLIAAFLLLCICQELPRTVQSMARKVEIKRQDMRGREL